MLDLATLVLITKYHQQANNSGISTDDIDTLIELAEQFETYTRKLQRKWGYKGPNKKSSSINWEDAPISWEDAVIKFYNSKADKLRFNRIH